MLNVTFEWDERIMFPEGVLPLSVDDKLRFWELDETLRRFFDLKALNTTAIK